MLRIQNTTRQLLARKATSRRSLWTTSTLTSTSPQSLIDSIPSSTSSQSPSFTLYTLSKHFPQDLVKSLQSSLGPSIGCLSEPTPSSSAIPPFTLSLAHYTPSTPTEHLLPFSTSLTGRPNVSLGREHKPRAGGRATEMELEFENRQFEKFLKGDKNWAFGDQLEINDSTEKSSSSRGGVEIPELNDVDPSHVRSIICFTADRIQPFLSALSQFPNSSTFGMTSTSTPFHSPQNYPFSLFFNEEVSAQGAVGVAVVDSKPTSEEEGKKVQVDYGNLTRFGPITTVTASRGNILLTLSSQNAAQLLLSSVQSLPSSNTFTGSSYDSSSPFSSDDERSLSNPNERTTKHISKDKDFFAAIFSPHEVGQGKEGEVVELGKSKLVCRIMAGDPKRGAVSFETEEEVQIGDKVVFLHRPSTTSDSSDSSTSSRSSSIFEFKTIEPSYVSPIHQSSSLPSSSSASTTTPETSKSEGVEKREGFLSFTENGIIVSRENRGGNGDGRVGREVRLAAIEGTSVRYV
ncbi:hypothetical protein JCM16303_003016 [Sporobolomyces ruberrimus]